jgi:hypothetical protein
MEVERNINMTEATDPIAAAVDMMTLKSQPNTLKKKPGVIGEVAKERFVSVTALQTLN